MKKPATTIFLLIFILFSGCIDENIQTAPAIQTFGRVNLHLYKDQAVKIVRMGLTDENSLIRMHAIEVTASTNTQELMPLVLKLAKDPAVPVRFAAAVAMGDISYRPSEFALREMLRDPDENVWIAAAYGLMKLGHRNLEEKIYQALESRDQTARANAALLLGKLGDKRALNALYKIINNPESKDMVRMQAIESIARLGDERVYERLWAMLISKFVDDRIMGVRAMGELGTKDARNAIKTLLYNSEDSPGDDILEVRLSAAEQLGRLGSRAGEGEVLDYFSKVSGNLSSLRSSSTNHLAIMAIGRIESSRLRAYLPKLLSNPNKDLKLVTAQSLLLSVR